MSGPGSRRGRCWAGLVLVALTTGQAVATDPVKPEHDATFRPSVMIRQGKSLGSGTIIASVEGETLILTAWHVVEGPEKIYVEIHRFNLGLENSRSSAGFPRRLAVSVVAREIDADLAILRLKNELAFPFVARLGPGIALPVEGTEVTTIGFDKGERLIGFSTRTTGSERLDMGRGGGIRSFVVTEDPPEHGRSGGGLFLANGSLVGVCVARAELEKGRKSGLFANLGDVKSLIETDEAIASTLVKSLRRPRSPAR